MIDPPGTYDIKLSFGSPQWVVYTNWKGEKGERWIMPLYLWHGSNEYHKEVQWILEVYDCDKKALRSFALKDIQPME